jgi:hypothetical protein
MYGPIDAAQNLFGTDRSGSNGIAPQQIPRGGSTLGPTKKSGQRCHGQQDEDGAEMIEFALVVLLLLALIYGIVSVGLSLAA